MKKMLILLSLLAGLLVGCQDSSAVDLTPTSTEMGAARAMVELIEKDMALRLTEQYIESQRIETGAKMTATQQVIDATATQQIRAEHAEMTRVAQAATHQAWEVTVQAGYAEGTSTAQAALVRATATAEAAGTATALSYVHATGTAQYQSTQNAIQATQDAAAWAAQATAQAAQSESALLAANRERMTNGVIAWGPWVIALVLMVALVFTLWKKSQVGTIERDANGFMPGVVVMGPKGQKMLFSPDRMPGPVLVIGPNGITAPQLVDAAFQDATTRRAQAVEAINALPPTQQRQGMGLMAQTFNASNRPTIEMVETRQIAGWVAEAEDKLSEEA